MTRRAQKETNERCPCERRHVKYNAAGDRRCVNVADKLVLDGGGRESQPTLRQSNATDHTSQGSEASTPSPRWLPLPGVGGAAAAASSATGAPPRHNSLVCCFADVCVCLYRWEEGRGSPYPRKCDGKR